MNFWSFKFNTVYVKFLAVRIQIKSFDIIIVVWCPWQVLSNAFISRFLFIFYYENKTENVSNIISVYTFKISRSH